MAHELATDCCVGSAVLHLEIREKVKAKYRVNENDSLSKMYARAIEDAVRDVELPPEAYDLIAQEIRANLAKREQKRQSGNR